MAVDLLVQVEVHLGRVLVQARRRRVLGFFQRHAVDVVDALADFVVPEEGEPASGQHS